MSELTPISFTVDGRSVTVEVDPKRSALSVLREDLGLDTMKPGCSPQGICGCCVVLLEGKPRITCTLPVKALGGKDVVSQRGLSDDERDRISQAFTSCGALQCGYCVPGLVMQTKALLDAGVAQDPEAVRKGFGMHTCRCTGWQATARAVGAAAAPLEPQATPLGAPWWPEVARLAVLGERTVLEDLHRPGMLRAGVVWTPAARVRVQSIDPAPALAVPGVRAVLCAEDLPVTARPLLVRTGGETRSCADALAIVIADSIEAVRAGVEAVVVDAAVLSADLQVLDAPDRVLAQASFTQGEPDGISLEGAATVEETYLTQRVDQGIVEPEGALVVPSDSGFVVLTQSEDPNAELDQLARWFDLDRDGLRFEHVPAGGGFGSKLSAWPAGIAMAVALASGRPVKVSLDMDEALRAHPKRPAARVRVKLAADRSGALRAVRMEVLLDVGPGAPRLDALVSTLARQALGPYRVPHARVDVRALRTDGPPSGPGRGLGVDQLCFALEGALDRLAAELGLDPVAVRRTNLLGADEDGGPAGRTGPSWAAHEVLAALEGPLDEARRARKHVGLALGSQAFTTPAGGASVDLHVVDGARVRVLQPYGEVGQGLAALVGRLGAELTGLPPETFVVETAGGLVWGGTEVPLLVTALADALTNLNAALGSGLEALAGRSFRGKTAPQQPAWTAAVVGQLAIVGAEGEVERIVTAVDVGRAWDAEVVRAAVEGAAHHGLGLALSEELEVDELGMPDTRFRNLGLVKAKAMPALETILVEPGEPLVPFGLRGPGELGCIPTAAAVASALRSYDGVWRTRLPMKESAAARAMGVRPARS